MTKKQISWLWPIIVAIIIFVGSIAANQINGPIAEFMQSNQGWVWAVVGLALCVAIVEAVRSQKTQLDPIPIDVTIADAHESLRRRYLVRIVEQFQYLPLRAIDFKSASAETYEKDRLHLADVYIALNTTARIAKDEAIIKATSEDKSTSETRLISAMEAVSIQPRLVLLGGPGCGKSTFINHLAFCLASDVLDPRQGWVDHLKGWSTELSTLLPVPLLLRDIAAWFAQTQCPDRKAGLLHSYLSNWLQQLNLNDFQQVLTKRLSEGQAILLLDGLDEVPLVDDILARIKEMIDDLPSAYPKTRIVVTCRVLSYQDALWQLNLKAWPTFELANLNEEQIEGFIHAWYQQLGTMKVVKHGDNLSNQLIRAVQRRDLWRLAQNPLLLTVMALVHSNKGELPDARVLLYEDVVDLLLWRWEAIKLEDTGNQETTWRQLLRVAELNDIDLKKALWELAFRVHGQTQRIDGKAEATADIAVSDLLETLRDLHPERSLDWAERLVQIMARRAGLLIESRPRVYTFPHRTFQEYLAGCHLSVQPDFTDQAKVLATKDISWWQVIVLAVGKLVHAGNIDPPLLLVDELCLENVPNQDDIVALRNVWLAGQCLVEIGLTRANRRNLGEKLIKRVRNHLTILVTNDSLNPRERAEAGTILSIIGDLRDFDEMILVPAGEFIMGSNEVEVEQAMVQILSDYKRDNYSEERKHARSRSVNTEKYQHTVFLDTYKISKYPVTNTQYSRFVSATGYEAPLHWRGNTPPPELRNHPVVYVSWYDACAYCTWLGRETGIEVRLPTEAEWEKAARGSEGYVYPWGNDFDAALCNVGSTGIIDTTAVGIFKKGASPYGCLDMVGNVWEWTLNLWGEAVEKTDYPYPYNAGDGREGITVSGSVRRVLRGGCFYNHAGRVRCAYRSGAHFAQDRENNNGFRIVALLPLS